MSPFPANQVQRPPSSTWKPSPPRLDYDSELALPPLRPSSRASLQVKAGSEALQNAVSLHQAGGSPPGPRVPCARRWGWVSPLEATANKNRGLLEAGSHPDHILFGRSIDSIMPISPNKEPSTQACRRDPCRLQQGTSPARVPAWVSTGRRCGLSAHQPGLRGLRGGASGPRGEAAPGTLHFARPPHAGRSRLSNSCGVNE